MHFGSFFVTEACVDSLLTLNNSIDTTIIVVDNGTENGSYDLLLNKYIKNSNVIIHKTNKNLGFARGNNIGFLLAKKKYNADIVCVINNDIIITQKDFLNVLTKLANDDLADIIAPCIIDSRGSYQNPLRTKRLTIKQINRALFYNRVMRIVYCIPLINRLAANSLEKRRYKKIITIKEKRIFDVIPHGAFVIYTKRYIDNEDFAFLDETFLFGEEDFLFDYLKKRKYSIVYCDDLVVHHNEDSSIKSITQNDIKKRLFIAKNKIKSLKQLKQYRKELSDD